jgi:hypothetical protein
MEGRTLNGTRVLKGRLLIALSVVSLYLVVVWVIPVGGFLLGPHWEDWANRVPFDSEQWKAAAGSVQRLNMAADLQAKYPLTGKTEAEVMAILGPPSQESAGDTVSNAGCQKIWQYCMGGDRHSIGPALAWFVVAFREGKVVTTCRYAD